MAAVWSPDAVEQLIKLWSEGMSCSQLSAALPGNPSRAAVAGKVCRLREAGLIMRSGAHLKGRATRQPEKARRTRLDKPILPRSPSFPLPKFKPYAIPDTAKPWMERVEGECSWPVAGEGADLIMCCAKTHTRWCAEHTAIGCEAPPNTANQMMRSLRRAVG